MYLVILFIIGGIIIFRGISTRRRLNALEVIQEEEKNKSARQVMANNELSLEVKALKKTVRSLSGRLDKLEEHAASLDQTIVDDQLDTLPIIVESVLSEVTPEVNKAPIVDDISNLPR